MALSEYWQIIKRRWWIFILSIVLTGASAYLVSAVQRPTYKATQLILIKPSRNDLGLTSAAQTLLRSYGLWMQSNTNAQQVINAEHLDVLPASLLSNVTIAPDVTRFAIQIDVVDANGEQAKRIANTWAGLLVSWRNSENAKIDQADRVDAEVLGDPTYALFRPQKKINTIAGAILGAILGGIIVFFIEYQDAAVLRSPQDVERSLQLPLLGVIPSLVGEDGEKTGRG